MAAKNLSDVMTAYSEGNLDALIYSQEAVNEVLALIVQELFLIAQQRQELAPYVEQDKALSAKGQYLAHMKSALQSIQRTLRDV